jgi:hypothetical protein
MRVLELLAACLIGAAPPRSADGPSDLRHRLEEFRSPEAVALTVQLDLHLERTLGRRTAKGDATLLVEADEDSTGLRVHWDASSLHDVEAELQARDRDPDRLAPMREAMTELEAARLAHLLDQTRTVTDLTKGALTKESLETYEGREVRRLEYRFQPRLSWTDAYYLGHSDGRLTVWVAADGTPLASESLASYEGKTSRVFGRYRGTTKVTTRYVAEGNRLRVSDRDVEELVSHQDGGDVQHTTRRFVIRPR